MTPPASTEMYLISESELSELEIDSSEDTYGCTDGIEIAERIRARGPVSAQQQAYVCKEGYTPNLKFRCSQQRDIKEPDCSKCGSGILQQAPSTERIGSIRQPILQEDAYLIERVNAGMGEWEYVIQYCGEYYATAPTEEIARSIVEKAQRRPALTQCKTCIFEGKRECIEHGYPYECIKPSCEFKIGKLAVIAPLEAQMRNREHDAALIAQEREKWESKKPGCYISCLFDDLCANDIEKIQEIERMAAAQAWEDVLNIAQHIADTISDFNRMDFMMQLRSKVKK